MTQSVSSNSIVGIAASKLTGALPAVSGAALTNVVEGVYFNASDPTISSNKSLGFLWANSTSGEMFMCTDATAGANVWTNVGSGSGNVAPYGWQGDVEFYMVGGVSGSTRVDTMDKVTFASDSSSTDIGDFGATTSSCSGSHSDTAGWCASGQFDSANSAAVKYFTFANATTTVDHGTLNDGNGHRRGAAGYSDGAYGYMAGGYVGVPIIGFITRYQYASANQAVDLGDLTDARKPVPCQSTDHAYVIGGEGASPTTRISRFNFASSITLAQHGDLASASGQGDNSAGVSSTTHGYVGGHYSTTHQKFSFASANTTATLANTTTSGHGHAQGAGSTTYGYYVGGAPSTSTVDRFQFGSDNDMTAITSLTQGRYGGTAHNN